MTSILSVQEIAMISRRPEEARSLPAHIYYDPDVYEIERTRVLRQGWMAVGFGMQIPAPGSIMPITFAGYELLLVRDLDGKVRCFHNLCRHRGIKLATAPARDQRKISCGYHCWTYSLKGELIATPHINGRNVNDHEGLDKTKLSLFEVRTDMWFDMIFVNLDGKTAPLQEHLKPLTRRISAEDLAAVRPSGEVVVYPRGANWKIVVEAGIEDYHLPFVHAPLDYNDTFTDEDGGDAYQGFSSTWGVDVLKMQPDPAAARDGVPQEDLPLLPSCDGKAKAEAFLVFLLPTAQFTMFANVIRLTTLNPVSVDRTIQTHAFYFRGEAATSARHAVARKQIGDFWMKIAREDDYVIEEQQRMARARAEAGLLGAYSPRWERNLLHFHQYLGRQYGHVGA